MRSSLLLTLTLSLAAVLSSSKSYAQAASGRSSLYAAHSEVSGAGRSGSAPAKDTETIILAGKITNPAGPLPGAVVILTATKQMAVTNADGEFEFTVPASAGALAARVTYAGYADEAMTLNASADESTVSLTNARVIVVSRKQQLKRYLKTAHKQIKRELKQVSAQ